MGAVMAMSDKLNAEEVWAARYIKVLNTVTPVNDNTRMSRHWASNRLKSRFKWGNAKGRMTTVAMNHRKNEIETGEYVAFKSRATIKLPDHIRVANRASKYPEGILEFLINKSSAKYGQY